MGKPFKFKQFAIHQDQCAMKVGTDGVLLGAWASLDSAPRTILDIGAGTGLIALMLAQRSDAPTIDAVELEPDAHGQCVENFEASPWADRLFCYHADWTEFVKELTGDGRLIETYDLIISNPPFYRGSPTPIKGENLMEGARMKARFFRTLPFEKLLKGSSLLLSGTGTFATIIPFSEEEGFIILAATFRLYPKRITRVRGNPASEIKRSLMEFTFIKSDPVINQLAIELERHQYTRDYIGLTKDFYLKM